MKQYTVETTNLYRVPSIIHGPISTLAKARSIAKRSIKRSEYYAEIVVFPGNRIVESYKLKRDYSRRQH